MFYKIINKIRKNISFKKLQLENDSKFKLTSKQYVFIISMHGTLIFKGMLSSCKLQSHKGLKISHLNCLSLMKHFDEVKCLVTETDIDIMTLSETHLCTNIDDSEIRIPGYTLIRRDRNRSGGGVAMYIRNNLIFVQRDELCSDTKLEILVAEIKLEKQKPFCVICWYRPPNSKIEVFNDFEKLMQRIDDLRVPYYVLGDVNCDVKQINIVAY